MKQKWYVATLIMRSRIDDNASTADVCDEQIRVVKAKDKEEAYEKVIKLGKEEEHSYENAQHETVYWEFVGLVDLADLYEPLEDGTEIRSRLFDSADPISLVSPKEKLSVYLGQNSKNQVAQEHPSVIS